jgi:beta-lactamase class C
MIFPVLLLALARGSVANIAMDAKVQHIVTADLAPETMGKAGGLAVAVYAEGLHTVFQLRLRRRIDKAANHFRHVV